MCPLFLKKGGKEKMPNEEQQKFIRIVKKIINNDDSQQFFYYGLVCNALIDKVITHDEWKFIKEQLTEMGYFERGNTNEK